MTLSVSTTPLITEMTKNFSVMIQPSGRHFSVADHETVLSAALAAGIVLPYGCRNGACGSCKGKVLAGHIQHGSHQPQALTEQERNQGMALFCCAKPLSDLQIECREIQGLADIPIKKMPCRVLSIERPTADVAIIQLQLPATEIFQYKAGQYIDILLKDGRRRSYSIASAPHRVGPLELHVRHMPGGLFTDHVFGVGATVLKPRDVLRFEGPLGSFFLREDNKPLIFVASGTGFAPIKAILESLFQQPLERPVTLYWGGRHERDLYCQDLVMQWTNQWANFKYIPVVSDASPEDGWAGRTGWVHQAVMADYADLSAHQVYACGLPLMVEAARQDFARVCGLPTDQFFADAFTSAQDV